MQNQDCFYERVKIADELKRSEKYSNFSVQYKINKKSIKKKRKKNLRLRWTWTCLPYPNLRMDFPNHCHETNGHITHRQKLSVIYIDYENIVILPLLSVSYAKFHHWEILMFRKSRVFKMKIYLSEITYLRFIYLSHSHIIFNVLGLLKVKNHSAQLDLCRFNCVFLSGHLIGLMQFCLET